MMRPGHVNQPSQPSENAAYEAHTYDVEGSSHQVPQGLSREEQAQQRGDDSDDGDFQEVLGNLF